MVSSVELESYSSEHLEQESDVEHQQPNTENDAAIAAILDENELLEEQAETSTSNNKRAPSGKQKAKVTALQTVVQSPNTTDLMKSIRMAEASRYAEKRTEKTKNRHLK